MNTYEGMFLFDPTFAVEWSNVEAEMNRLMERAGAQIITCKKWDERRLAYEIKGRKRGCYVLTYFKSAPDRIVGIERDVQLSEHVLRCLILNANDISEDFMHAELPADSQYGDEELDPDERDEAPRARGPRFDTPPESVLEDALDAELSSTDEESAPPTAESAT